jgi:hypothetical protein
LTGLFLILVSLGFLYRFNLDSRGGALGLCGFLFFFVSGWLVLVFFWNDGDIAKLRRTHKRKPQRSPHQGRASASKCPN